MKFFCILGLMAAILVMPPSLSQAAAKEDANATMQAAKAQIERHAKQESSADGECDVSGIKHATYDSRHEVFIYHMAACGGGNHAEQYIFVMTLKDGKWVGSSPLHIGGINDSNNFTADSMKVRSKSIILTGKAWKRDDSQCCPSLKKTRQFTVVNDEIKAVGK